MIKEIPLKELTFQCAELLMKTYTELGQTPSEAVVLTMSNSLANDLKRRFDYLTWYDVVKAFQRGVRETDDFSINVKTYYKWLTFWKKQVIDAAEYEVRTMHQPRQNVKYYREKDKHQRLLLMTKENNNELS